MPTYAYSPSLESPSRHGYADCPPAHEARRGRLPAARDRPLHGRRPAAGPDLCLFRPLAACLRRHQVDRHQGGAGDQGRDRGHHGGGHQGGQCRQFVAAPAGGGPRRHQADHAGPAGAGGRPGAPHRRGGRHGDRRDLGGGAGRRRGGRGGLRSGRCGLRSARRREAGRAAGVAGSAGQHRDRLGRPCRQPRRDRGEGRRGHEVGRACRADLARASAHQRRLDGAARRHRELRCGERQLPAPRLLAGRPRHARLDGRRDGRPAGEDSASPPRRSAARSGSRPGPTPNTSRC